MDASILDVLLVPAAIVTAFVQLAKTTLNMERFGKLIPWIAVLVLGPLSVFLCGSYDGTVKQAILNGLIAGFTAVGMFEVAKGTPGVKELVK